MSSYIKLLAALMSLALASALFGFAISLTSAIVLTFAHILCKPYFSPLRQLRGPGRASLWAGNWDEILDNEPGVAARSMHRKFGGAVRIHDYLGGTLLLLSDPRAVKHVLVRKASQFKIPDFELKRVGRVLGHGVNAAQGEDHTRQRKILAPAFAPKALERMQGLWWEGAARLRDHFERVIVSGEVDVACFASPAAAEAYKRTKPASETVIDPQRAVRRATMDIIGLAAFGYDFNSLDPTKSNELADAFNAMLSSGAKYANRPALNLFIQGVVEGLIDRFPWMHDYLPFESVKRKRAAYVTSQAESRIILEQRKADALAGSDAPDILSLLLKSNRGETKYCVSDEELLGQMSTMTLAGHRTIAISLVYALARLGRHPEIQAKLRKECIDAFEQARADGKDGLDDDWVGSPSRMPYLDAFAKEGLRLDSPVTWAIRETQQHDFIPLHTPIESVRGETLTHVAIKKGQLIYINIQACNLNPEVFGEDGDSFLPERWLATRKPSPIAPGIFSRMMTFIDGPRACIGSGLAIAELKAILVTLVMAFEFDKRDEAIEIGLKTQGSITKPVVKGEEHLGYRIPIRIKLISKE